MEIDKFYNQLYPKDHKGKWNNPDVYLSAGLTKGKIPQFINIEPFRPKGQRIR